MGEGGGTQRARVQALRIANSEPALSARARATSRPRSPTRNRGAAGARAGWARGGGGRGLPSAGNYTGRGEGGGRRPLRDVDPQVSRAARALRPGPAPALSSARSARRCGRAIGGAGAQWVCPGRPGLRPHGVLEARGAGPCKGPPSLARLPGGLARPAGASTLPSALQLRNSRDSPPWPSPSRGPRALIWAEGTGECTASPRPPTQPRLPPSAA